MVVEAAAGYGKSVFAAELIEATGDVPVEIVLEEGPVSAKLLAARLRGAVARAGFVDVAGAMSLAGEDPAGTIDAMLAGLQGESYVLVIDDAHHAARDAAVLIDRIATQIARPGRLVVLARQLPPGADRLRHANAVHIGALDLALRDDEALAMCRDGFELDVSADDARFLESATGGWTAAAVLAASRAKRTKQGLRTMAGRRSAGATAGRATPVSSMLDDAIGALGAEGRGLAQIARLPLLDRALVGAVVRDEHFFDKAMALGIPMTPVGDGWWEFPGPVREYLASLDPQDSASLERAARHYELHDQLGMALQMLLAAGEEAAAAALLSRLDAASLESIDPLELLVAFERLPEVVVGCYPWATFHVARSCGIASFLGSRARLLERLAETVPSEDDPELRRAVDAERAIDMMNAARPLDAEAIGRDVLASVGATEQFTRARALTAIGFGLCAHREGDGRLSESALADAAAVFDQVMAIYRGLGCREWVSGVAAPRALWTALGIGRPDVARDVLDAALADCTGRPRRIGRLLFHRAQVHAELGRFDEGLEDLAESERIGGTFDPILVPFASWGRMAIASYRGDPEDVLRCAQEVEAKRGEWWAAVGAEFLADAADCLDRVGYTAQAREYLTRALAEPHKAERWTALAECALDARHGDPTVAEAHLSVVHEHGIFPKEYWRVTLLRAYAAWRRGDDAAGALAARAFEESARLGQPRMPLVKEREVAESLLALAIATGSPSASHFEGLALPVSLVTLGRFELSRGGRPVTIRSGQAARVLKVVAASGGRALAERVIESLWQDADQAAGRNRLRTVLSRLRDDAPEAVVRDGDLLVLGPEVRLDLTEFQREARQAQALGLADVGPATAVATSAIARYRGDLLPDDLYEEWADEPRETTRRTMLDLLDLCAEAAARRGDLDEARRMVQRTIELAPYEDDRYLRVAEILNEQGRRGAALSVIRRARSTLAALGLELAPQLLELRDSLATFRDV